jgi:two-component system sensor kinase FixL
VITILFGLRRASILALASAMIAIIAAADWYVGNRASLGVLYIFPVMLASVVLRLPGVLIVSFVCACLKALFDIPGPPFDLMLRPVFAFLAYVGSGLFITALIRNRQLMAAHLQAIGREQELRHAAEAQLSLLVESSPAAIITLDADGTIIAANKAARNLFHIPAEHELLGRQIRNYLPILGDALQLTGPEGFCIDVQSRGYRDNGDIFSAHAWFSSWGAPEGIRLAAIVVDSSEELRNREQEALRQLNRGNRIAAAAVFHEVRNLCVAIGLLSAGLLSDATGTGSDDLQRLNTLVSGLERITSMELFSAVHEVLEDVPLRQALDDLRIIIEPAWREIDASIVWEIPDEIPNVLGERNGLLQVFLNLAQNSYRAVQQTRERTMQVKVAQNQQRVMVRFDDTGLGIEDPSRLFEPFRSGSNGSGLGLYVSRAVMRSYGGDLRFMAQPRGAAFVVELQVAE